RGPASTPGQARLVLAAASFRPAALEIDRAGASARYSLPGGLAQITSEPLRLPGELRLSAPGDEPLYLWWGELCDPQACEGGVLARDEVFVQVTPRPGGDPAQACADIRLHTEQLPEGRQKLTALISLAYAPPTSDDWREVGQWVFFPNGGDPLLLDLDMAGLKAALYTGGRPVELAGGVAAPADGRYQASLLLANDAKVVYGTTLASWQRAGGAVQKPVAESVIFDVVPLPRPASARVAQSADGTIRLEGYTLPGARARPGAVLELTLVWQSLKKIDGDLQARVLLRDASGRALAEQTQPLGAREHGTHAWQEGELAEQRVVLALPNDVAAQPASLSVELIGPDGRPLPFRDGAGPLPIAELALVR
ncbi:MAG TPA: hypothetical protein PKK15_26460, partial [Kouleothrix sp.]|nr:hypothetical protein [Kouleothrix sp.]